MANAYLDKQQNDRSSTAPARSAERPAADQTADQVESATRSVQAAIDSDASEAADQTRRATEAFIGAIGLQRNAMQAAEQMADTLIKVGPAWVDGIRMTVEAGTQASQRLLESRGFSELIDAQVDILRAAVQQWGEQTQRMLSAVDETRNRIVHMARATADQRSASLAAAAL